MSNKKIDKFSVTKELLKTKNGFAFESWKVNKFWKLTTDLGKNVADLLIYKLSI